MVRGYAAHHSFAAALSHYESSALAWERAAFIRARPAAGDIGAGEEFLQQIRPFIWRRANPFGAARQIRGWAKPDQFPSETEIRDEIEPHDMLMAAATASARALGAAGSRIYREDAAHEGFAVAAEYGNVEGIEDLGQKIAGLRAGDVINIDTANWSALLTTTQYRGDVNGALAMWKPAKSEAWDDDHRLMLTDVANQLGIANEQIANHERIVALSRTDSMTGLLNRRAFYEEELPRRISRLERANQTASMFYVDMDNFKRVNDVHGHQAGDEAILFLRDMLINFSRPGDLIARLGGDEFAMWLDGIDEETSRKRAGQLIETSKQMVTMSGDEDHPLGISIGVAFFDPKSGESLDDLLARADAAMYSVKKRSKGGFEMAPPPGAPLEMPD